MKLIIPLLAVVAYVSAQASPMNPILIGPTGASEPSRPPILQNCPPPRCPRLFKPVCGQYGNKRITVPNFCLLQADMRCARRKNNANAGTGRRINVKFVKRGPCGRATRRRTTRRRTTRRRTTRRTTTQSPRINGTLPTFPTANGTMPTGPQPIG